MVSYDRRTRTPHWVFEHLTKDSVRRNEAVDRARSQFVEDKSVHRYFRATNEDYRVRGGGGEKGFENIYIYFQLRLKIFEVLIN